MQVKTMAEGLLTIERNETTYLGIATQISGRSFAVQQLTAHKRRPGWIVRDNTISEWLPGGFLEHNQQVVMYGPYEEGVTLEESLSGDPKEVLERLERFARAIHLLVERQIPVGRYHTRGIIFLKDGATLFLPQDIMDTIRDHEPVTQRITYYENTNHPDLESVDNVSYALASLTYRVLTGDYPYRAEKIEDVHIRIRAGYSLDPVYHEPRIREDVSNFIIGTLRDPEHNMHSLEQWIERLADWNRNGAYREVTEQGRAMVLQQAEATWKRMTRAFNRKEYIRKHGKATVLIIVMVLIVGTIPGTIISKALQPRSTHGFSAEKVVRTFYMSMNTLDQTTMQDCVIDGAGSATISQVMNLFVTSRMRMSVEMHSGILDAQKWVDAGKPALKPSSFVYGVSDLKVTMTSQSPDHVVATATYIKWQPDFPQEPTASPSKQPSVMKSVAFQRKDTLYMKKDRGDWVIYKIQQNTDKPIPADTVQSTLS
jgi:LmbE family N-acetylglucosaminyl deacetylase